MTLWMPNKKKQILYAPMLATFGGGSVLGFRGTAAGGLLAPFSTTQTVHDSTYKYFGFNPSSIMNHATNGAETTPSDYVQGAASVGQVYNLGGDHIYPIVLQPNQNAGDNISQLNNVTRVLCLLKINSDGTATLGPSFYIYGVDVHSDLTAPSPNYNSANGPSNSFWQTNQHGSTLYPIQYTTSNFNTNKFGLVFAGDNNGYRYCFHGIFTINPSTLEITMTNNFSQRVTNVQQFTQSNPFISSNRGFSNVDLWQSLFTAQGFHLAPRPNTDDKVGFINGGLHNFYGKTSWNASAGWFETTGGYANLGGFSNWSINQTDPIAFNGHWDGSEYIGFYNSWGNNSPVRKVGLNTGNTGSITPAFTNNSWSFANSGEQPPVGSYDPKNNESYFAVRDGNRALRHVIAGGSYTNPSPRTAVSHSSQNSTWFVAVPGLKDLTIDNDTIGRAGGGDNAQVQSGFDVQTNDVGISGDYYELTYWSHFGYTYSPTNASRQSSFRIGKRRLGNGTSYNYPAIIGQYD